MAETHEFCSLSFRPTLVAGGVGCEPPHEVMTSPRQRVWARGRTSRMYSAVEPVVAMLATPGWVPDSQQGSDCRQQPDSQRKGLSLPRRRGSKEVLAPHATLFNSAPYTLGRVVVPRRVGAIVGVHNGR